MGRPRETFNKKEQEKNRAKRKKEKEAKKEDRKANSDKGKKLEDMFAYVDAYGNLVSTPPDPKLKHEVKMEDIRISISRRDDSDLPDPVKTGTVTFFNDSKGYGFIRDDQSRESVFVHINELEDRVKENDKVTFETERSPKGMNAVRVKLYKPPPPVAAPATPPPPPPPPAPQV